MFLSGRKQKEGELVDSFVVTKLDPGNNFT